MYSVEPKVYDTHKKSDKKTESKKLKPVRLRLDSEPTNWLILHRLTGCSDVSLVVCLFFTCGFFLFVCFLLITK